MRNLKPIKYNYKEDKEEQYLGFIAEDVPELVAMNERNGLHTMDVVTILTKVVQNQQEEVKTLKEQQKEKDKNQKKIIENLLKRIERMEKSEY